MRLILVRHPQPMVAPGLCYGSTDLAPEPQELARVLASLRRTLPPDAALFSSPLRRCAELARQLPYASLTVDARLVELDFGDWEMRDWDHIPRAEIDAWAADVSGYHPGGGDSVLRMAERVAAFYADLLRLKHSCVIIICHAGTIRLLSACQAGLTPPDMARQAAASAHSIAYGASLILETEPSDSTSDVLPKGHEAV